MAGLPVPGARSPEWYRARYTDVSASGFIGTATAGQAGIITAPADAKFAIYVQKLTVHIHASAAQQITFRNSNAATQADNVMVVAPSAAQGTILTVDFGARGYPLPAGTNLDIFGTAGPGYVWAIDAYAERTATEAATTADRFV